VFVLILAFDFDGYCAGNTSDERNITDIVKSLSKEYDNYVRPNYGGPAVVVGISVYILSIHSLSEEKMDFEMTMYFRQFWKDPRLSFERKPGLEKLVLGKNHLHIWTPDTFFVNEKDARVHDQLNPNEFVRISHTGEILVSKRLSGKFSCPMDLRYFPMDSQLCYMEIESFGYNMADIRYKWNDGLNSVQISSDVSLPAFKVLGHRQKTIEVSLSTGNYSRLVVEIQFVRSSGFYILSSIIPMILLVILSFVSFLLTTDSNVMKLGIPVCSFLGVLFLMVSINIGLPKISYVKAIDVHSLLCTAVVFLVVVGNAAMLFLEHRYGSNQGSVENKDGRPQRTFKIIVTSLKIVFVVMFIIMEFALWITYNKLSDNTVDDLIYLY